MIDTEPQPERDELVPLALAVFTLAALILLVGLCGYVLSRSGAL